jgi:hypothetical protein
MQEFPHARPLLQTLQQLSRGTHCLGVASVIGAGAAAPTATTCSVAPVAPESATNAANHADTVSIRKALREFVIRQAYRDSSAR